MEGLTWASILSVLSIVVALCSVASFYFGRRDMPFDEWVETDIQYIKETIRDTTKSLDSLSLKLDAQDKQRENDYRQMLVELTELKSSYKSLHIRVDNLEKKIQ